MGDGRRRRRRANAKGGDAAQAKGGDAAKAKGGDEAMESSSQDSLSRIFLDIGQDLSIEYLFLFSVIRRERKLSRRLI